MALASSLTTQPCSSATSRPMHRGLLPLPAVRVVQRRALQQQTQPISAAACSCHVPLQAYPLQPAVTCSSLGMHCSHAAAAAVARHSSSMRATIGRNRLMVARSTASIAMQGDGSNNYIPEVGSTASTPSPAHLHNGQVDASARLATTTSSSNGNGAGAAAAAAQEASPGTLFDKIRAMAFFGWSFLLAVPLFVTMMAMAPAVMAFDKYRRLAQHFVNNIWAKVSTSLFYRVEVVGRENLPPQEKPVVYVANHQSFLDIYSLFHLNRPFKFISKTSNFLIPIVGWSMFLTGHVMINRVDRRSQLECLKQCGQLLGNSAPVLFFPEGTRSKTRVMAGFKKGAFSVAVKAGVDVVPVTLIGTGDLMPSGQENVLKRGGVKIIVHKPIPTKGRNADKVCDEARAVIAAALPPELQGSASYMAPDDS